MKFFKSKYFKFLNDQAYIKLKYFVHFRKKLNLENPQTFNEKLQWLKLNDRKDIYTTMVDKYEVKEYVGNIIGKEYIIPTIGIYNNFDEIDFNLLPNQFVIKCTHDSGSTIICKDKAKLNIKETKKKINKRLKTNYFYASREWPYKNVKPRIIIEKYMEDEKTKELRDYKFFCFNGKVKNVLVCSNRFENLKETFFDENWNLLQVKRPNHDIEKNITMPINFDRIKELSEKMSRNIPFVRIDFYEINGLIYFGEMTFFPASGFSKFEPEEWDYRFGQMLDISGVKNEK